MRKKLKGKPIKKRKSLEGMPESMLTNLKPGVVYHVLGMRAGSKLDSNLTFISYSSTGESFHFRYPGSGPMQRFLIERYDKEDKIRGRFNPRWRLRFIV